MATKKLEKPKACKYGCLDRGDGCIHNWHPVVWGVVVKNDSR